MTTLRALLIVEPYIIRVSSQFSSKAPNPDVRRRGTNICGPMPLTSARQSEGTQTTYGAPVFQLTKHTWSSFRAGRSPAKARENKKDKIDLTGTDTRLCGSAKATRGSAASERPFILPSIALHTLFRNCSLTASCAMPAVTVTACQSSCLFDGRHHWGILTGIHGNAAPSVRDTLPFKLPDDGVSIKKKLKVCEEVVLKKHHALTFIVIKEELRRALLAGPFELPASGLVPDSCQCRLRLHAQGLRQASAFALGAFNALLDPYGHVFPHPRVEEVPALCPGDEACISPQPCPLLTLNPTAQVSQPGCINVGTSLYPDARACHDSAFHCVPCVARQSCGRYAVHKTKTATRFNNQPEVLTAEVEPFSYRSHILCKISHSDATKTNTEKHHCRHTLKSLHTFCFSLSPLCLHEIGFGFFRAYFISSLSRRGMMMISGGASQLRFRCTANHSFIYQFPVSNVSCLWL
jgi:hypothetical protein